MSSSSPPSTSLSNKHHNDNSNANKEVYNEDALPQYTPMPYTLAQIRAAIPSELFIRSTTKGFAYLARDLIIAAFFWYAATFIDPFFQSTSTGLEDLVGTNFSGFSKVGLEVMRWACWGVYWWFQGLTFTGIWVIGHECGHGAFSDSKLINDVVGFVTHTPLWTPYFSWRISHHRHHISHASMERDEVYVPWTRGELGIPNEGEERPPAYTSDDEEDHHHGHHHGHGKEGGIDYSEYLGDTPIYTLFMLIRQQLLAFPAYLLYNVSGQRHYPKWTNHFDPSSILFAPSQRPLVLLSNLGMLTMLYIVYASSKMYGFGEVVKYYGIPWLGVSHWFIMITYLHHTDPMLPHYRASEWNYQRGAAATVDRPFLGWMGRFFLHDVAHFHVVHHFFPKMPWYNGEQATTHLRAFLGEEHYKWDDKPVFKALWDNYNRCQFVEDEGDVLFYRDRKGQAAKRPADAYYVKNQTRVSSLKEKGKEELKKD